MLTKFSPNIYRTGSQCETDSVYFRFYKATNFSFTKVWSDLSSGSFYEHERECWQLHFGYTLSFSFSVLPRSPQRPSLRAH